MARLIDRPLSFWIALARMSFENDLARLMEEKGVSKADLADAAGVSPPFITKVLNGTNNYTLKTMAKLARAVGAVLEVRLADENREAVRVVDYETARKLDDAAISSTEQNDPTSATDSATVLSYSAHLGKFNRTQALAESSVGGPVITIEGQLEGVAYG